MLVVQRMSEASGEASAAKGPHSILTDRENKFKKAHSQGEEKKKRVSVSSQGNGSGPKENFRRHSNSVTSIDKGTGRRGHWKGYSSRSSKGSWRDSYNGDSLDLPTDDCDSVELEEPFSESEDEDSKIAAKRRGTRPHLRLPVPRRRIRTLSGTVPPTGYSPVWGGPTMCLGCMEFFDLPDEIAKYTEHLMEKHNILITDLQLIVDVKRYVEYWRSRFGEEKVSVMFPKVEVGSEPGCEERETGLAEKEITWYYLMSPAVEEDRRLRERLALRRLEEVLSCQQREREDFTFARTCLFCRYRARGNRSKIIHHLYMIHHLNLGSPDNLVFVNEYLDLLKGKLDKNQCLYCEKIFEDHTTLMEHMRKRQHREVNPKNSYYDRFYVINYLELGKKWLEVLAEDFEDKMPCFDDSDEEDEQESWAEWLEDNTDEDATMVVCLFCDAAFHTADDLIAHSKGEHAWDVQEHLYRSLQAASLSFYDRMKILNFIRKTGYSMKCWVCGTDENKSWDALRKHQASGDHLANAGLPLREEWDLEEYLVPVFENDHLLWVLDSALDSADAAPASANLPPESDLPPTESDPAPPGEENASGEVIAEDLPELLDSVLQNDPELLDQLR